MKIPINQTELGLGHTRYGPMIYLKHDKFVGGSIAAYGDYSPAEVMFLRSLLQPGDCVMDIGANLGALTMPFAVQVGEKGSVFAFEPQPLVARLLVANCAMNFFNQVQVINAAVGEARSTLTLPIMNYNADSNYGAADMRRLEELSATTDNVVTVDIVALDDLFSTDPTNPNKPYIRPKLMKIDVEGMELGVLKGGAKLIAANKPILFVECDRPDTAPELISYIREIGYTPYWVINMLYDEKNLYRNPVNLWPSQASFNLLCMPTGTLCPVNGLHEAHADDAGIPNGLVPNGCPVLTYHDAE